MPADLTLPVSRLPGVVEVAREVLGLDPWECGRGGIALFPTWWPYDLDDERRPGVPLRVPAGRLVVETWWDRKTHNPLPDDLTAACLYLGDLLRVVAALGVDVPAGTVPRLERAKTAAPVWSLVVGALRVDFVPEVATGAEVLVPGLPDAAPRAALDAIVREVCGG